MNMNNIPLLIGMQHQNHENPLGEKGSENGVFLLRVGIVCRKSTAHLSTGGRRIALAWPLSPGGRPVQKGWFAE